MDAHPNGGVAGAVCHVCMHALDCHSGSGLRGPGGAADDSDEPFGPLSTQQSAAVSVADESYQCDSPQPPARRSHGGSLIVNRSHGSQVGFIGVPPLPDEDDDDSNAQPCNAQGLLASMEVVLATVDDWRFDAFKLAEATGGHPMSALGFYLIMRSGLIESLQLDGPALARFLRKIEDSYPDNPYHNKTHSADVLQVRTALHMVLLTCYMCHVCCTLGVVRRSCSAACIPCPHVWYMVHIWYC